MTSQAVNPAGTKWAGAWNVEPKDEPVRSAVWLIDFPESTAKPCQLPEGTFVTDVTWADNDTVRALTADSGNLALVGKSSMVYIDVATAKRERVIPFKTAVARVLAWSPGLDKFVAQLPDSGEGLRLAVLSETGEPLGKEVTPELPARAELYTDAAVSSDGTLFVFSISDTEAKGGRSYYLGNTTDGAAVRMFDLEQLPGRLEGMWVSPAGILLACTVHEDMVAALYDTESGNLKVMKKGVGADVKSTWPGTQEEIRYATYSGGYGYDLASGKKKVLFDLKKSGSVDDDEWRQTVQGARLYPQKGGEYVSIKLMTGSIDIRGLAKDGTKARDILARK